MNHRKRQNAVNSKITFNDTGNNLNTLTVSNKQEQLPRIYVR